VEAARDHNSAEVLATEFTRDAGLPTLEGELGFNAELQKS
jgi:hypothetical protein